MSKGDIYLVKLMDADGKPALHTLERYNLTVLPTLRSTPNIVLPYYQVVPTRSVRASYPNKFGLYDMTGNVSELVEGKLVMGLNFKTALDGHPLFGPNYTLSQTRTFVKPESWIGFRCVCEMFP